MQGSIARYEEERAGFFAWLQVEPLTEGQLLQLVLLPNFAAVPQSAVLDRVLRAGAWRTDAELRTALAAISFVPRGVSLWLLDTGHCTAPTCQEPCCSSMPASLLLCLPSETDVIAFLLSCRGTHG